MMNKSCYWTIMILLAGFYACQKKDLGNTASPVNLNIALEYNSDVNSLGLRKDSALVRITNNTNGTIKEMYTNTNGVANFESLTPGIYTITASITIPKSTYEQLSGTVVDHDVVFNSNLTNQSITDAQSNINMSLIAGRIGNWVFKQLYYCGSNVATGASFRDQFLEIYNNSNDTLYADSLCIGSVIGVNNTTANYPGYGYLATNQYDWTKSVGMNDANANTNYLYLRTAFMIPGTGKKYPVLPGKSLIIAQTAQNHTAAYKLNDSTILNVTDGTLTVDLSKADFETYLVDYKKAEAGNPANFDPYKYDLDNPGVTNADIIYLSQGSEWTLESTGREAMVLYTADGANPKAYPYFALPTVTNVTVSTVKYQQIPVKNVIDAVELQRVNVSERVPKKLPSSLDAGPTNVTAGNYSSQSLVRKTVRTVNGKRVLQDTNNSANDFFTKKKADPSKTEASFTE